MSQFTHSLMRRHDLVYLSTTQQVTLLDTSLPPFVSDAITTMIRRRQPFTVCRQLLKDSLYLATSCLIHQQKYRVVIRLTDTQTSPPIRIRPPLLLADIVFLLPAAIHLTTQNFIQRCGDLGCEVRVYGSYANQAVTQLPFITPTSDLDLLLVITDINLLSDILRVIASFRVATQAVMRIDGELRLPKGGDIAFNEWLMALQHNLASLMVKTLYHVELQPMSNILGLNACEFEHFTARTQHALTTLSQPVATAG